MLVITLTPDSLGSQVAENQHAADDLGIRWIEIEAGSFRFGHGGNTTQLTVGRFMMSETEVTIDQYDTFCDATGKRKPDDNGWGRGARPVINVSYDDAVEFCQWVSGETGSAVRLPNEVEWEYAAQGGCHSKGYEHSGRNDKDEVSWNEDNSGNRTHPVGTKKPNELGLYDMSGNLWEWCAHRPETNSSGSQTEPQESGNDVKRMVRGDSFDNPGESMGYRQFILISKDSRHINIGFRIAKSD
jgi:formylglycine-generating enzyme required for sulfatase activity